MARKGWSQLEIDGIKASTPAAIAIGSKADGS